MIMTTKIVTVWLDETSDVDDPRWIVDTDTQEGGESETIAAYPGDDDGFDRAVSRAKKAGIKHGCDVHICGPASEIVLTAGEYVAD
jgi:hypothetical protein